MPTEQMNFKQFLEHCGCELEQEPEKKIKKRKKRLKEDITDEVEDLFMGVINDHYATDIPFSVEFYDGSNSNGRWTGMDYKWEFKESPISSMIDNPAMKAKLTARSGKSQEEKEKMIEDGKKAMVRALKATKKAGVKAVKIGNGKITALDRLAVSDIITSPRTTDVHFFTDMRDD